MSASKNLTSRPAGSRSQQVLPQQSRCVSPSGYTTSAPPPIVASRERSPNAPFHARRSDAPFPPLPCHIRTKGRSPDPHSWSRVRETRKVRRTPPTLSSPTSQVSADSPSHAGTRQSDPQLERTRTPSRPVQPRAFSILVTLVGIDPLRPFDQGEREDRTVSKQ